MSEDYAAAGENRAARRMPVRTAPIMLDGDYSGWTVTVRINTPMSVFVGITEAQDTAELFRLLATICLASNFVDDDGAPIDVTRAEDWPRVGADLMAEVIRRWKAAVQDPFGASRPSAMPSPTPPPTGDPSPPPTPT